ncbi:MAG: 50S ribosomal protein L24 [Candidatus Pacearchaeota archaeon]
MATNAWSAHWKASKKPGKQRKYRYNAPLHIRHKLISANLSKELRKKYQRRSFPLRKGDIVKIMRGKFKGKQAKVERVDLKNLKVYLEGIAQIKQSGVKTPLPFDPSNLQIIELDLSDKKRVSALERKIKS